MSVFSQLREAIAGLRDDVDAHWLGNQPNASHISDLVGFNVAQADLSKYGRTRRGVRPSPPMGPTLPPGTVLAEDAPPTPWPGNKPQEPLHPSQKGIEATNTAVARAEEALADARQNFNLLTRRTKELRAKMADAIQRWQVNSGAPKNFSELHKQEMAADREHRMAVARGEIAGPQGPTPGPSYLDRSLATYGNDVNAVARGRMQTGHRRGAMNAHNRGRRLLPSER